MWLKICGMTSPAAVTAALEAGVDAIGFVFSPSIRQLTPVRAAQLAAPARGRVDCVAVTLHPDQALIDEILAVFAPDVLQADSDDFAAITLPQTLVRLPVLRAGAATGVATSMPARILFEGPRSGSGATCDWSLATRLATQTQLILAGGLHADNVAAAIHSVRPFGVDTSSGVESLPGMKDPEKILQFVRAARAAFREIEP